MNIFKTFSNCLQSKSFSLNEGFDSFMFCRYLGMNKQTLPYAQILNQYYKYMDDETQYEFVKNLKKPSFIKWISYKSKNTIDGNTEELVLKYMQKYNLSRKRAQEYAELI